MTKIKLDSTVRDAYVLIADGNIGALNVLMQIEKDGAKHDPYCDPLMTILDFDTLRVYGSRIWQLYKDVCGQNLGKMLVVLRACQLGHLAQDKLIAAIGTDERRGVQLENFEELKTKVLAELPDFKLEIAS